MEIAEIAALVEEGRYQEAVAEIQRVPERIIVL